MFSGKYFQLNPRDQFAELVFDSQADKVNTLSQATLKELEQIVAILTASSVKGLIIRSGKKLFSAGADVTEFRDMFAEGAVKRYLATLSGCTAFTTAWKIWTCLKSP